VRWCGRKTKKTETRIQNQKRGLAGGKKKIEIQNQKRWFGGQKKKIETSESEALVCRVKKN